MPALFDSHEQDDPSTLGSYEEITNKIAINLYKTFIEKPVMTAKIWS
jgi:hypothetical protein